MKKKIVRTNQNVNFNLLSSLPKAFALLFVSLFSLFWFLQILWGFIIFSLPLLIQKDKLSSKDPEDLYGDLYDSLFWLHRAGIWCLNQTEPILLLLLLLLVFVKLTSFLGAAPAERKKAEKEKQVPLKGTQARLCQQFHCPERR